MSNYFTPESELEGLWGRQRAMAMNDLDLLKGALAALEYRGYMPRSNAFFITDAIRERLALLDVKPSDL